MKKLLSFLAGIAVVGSSLLGAVGCKGNGLFGKDEKKSLTGTTAAKIALARERLDESVFSEEMSFWETQESAVAVKSNEIAKSGVTRLSAKRAKSRAVAVEKGGAAEQNGYTVEDGKVRWHTFGNNSRTMENYQNVFRGIEIDAAQVAESIGTIKKYVGVTDKWVGDFQMLMVDESRETLVEKYHFEDPNTTGYQLAHRYTREDAKNIYDIYSTWTESSAEGGQTRMRYIPGEYYESSYMHTNGFSDYFMAENSSGYWKLSRFSGFRGNEENRSIYIEHYVLKDGLGIGFGYSRNEMVGMDERVAATYDFFDTTTEQDLFRASEYEDSYNVSTYLGNVASGLAYVEADEEDTRVDDGVCINSMGMAGRLVFDGGRLGESTEEIRLSGVDVMYDYMHEKYYAMADMGVQADSLLQALEKADNYWMDNGATLQTKLSSLSDAVTYAQSLFSSFEETFEWNGEKVATFEGLEKGQEELNKFFADSAAAYEKVKNYESVEYTQEEVTVGGFAPIDALDTAQSVYANGKITLNNASLSISDTTFLEAGGEYVLKIALALKNKDGLQSVNTVALTTDTEQKTAFAEGAEGLTVTGGGEYAVPANLAEGNYAVVAYVATADEGIRVSEMKEVVFGEVTEGEVSSTAMKVDVKKANEGLTVHYGVKLSVQAEIKAQASYTAEEIERALTRAVVTYGYPKAGESVTTEAGEAVTAETAIEAGTYKLKFFMHTEDGMAEAYAYVTIE